jgi:hypothetical protein
MLDIEMGTLNLPVEYAVYMAFSFPEFIFLSLMFATGALVYDVFNLFLDLAGAFLDASNQFVLFAFRELEVVVRQLREFLF